MLSRSFRTKAPTLYSSQNFGPVWSWSIFDRYLIEIFFLAWYFSICFSDHYICDLEFFVQKIRHCILEKKKKRKILASRIMGHFRKKFNIIFFFLQKIFPFVSWNYKNAIYKFQWQNTKIVFWSKFLASGTYGHFRTKFNRVFFFLTKDFFICFFDL